MGFYYKSFETKNCKEKFKPTLFIENDYCYSQSQQQQQNKQKNPLQKFLNSKNHKKLNFNSIRLFWNLEKNFAQIEFFKQKNCQGIYSKKVEIKENICSSLDGYKVIVSKKN